MDSLILFTDGSVNTKTKVGYGAFYAFNERWNITLEEAKGLVKIKRFEDTSSTKLELQTLLWALSQIDTENFNICIYTDSQNIINLQERRSRLVKNNYGSKKNKLISNHLLYKEFFYTIDNINCEFIKVSGHKASSVKSTIDKFFSIVDKASRNALREDANQVIQQNKG